MDCGAFVRRILPHDGPRHVCEMVIDPWHVSTGVGCRDIIISKAALRFALDWGILPFQGVMSTFKIPYDMSIKHPTPPMLSFDIFCYLA